MCCGLAEIRNARLLPVVSLKVRPVKEFKPVTFTAASSVPLDGLPNGAAIIAQSMVVPPARETAVKARRLFQSAKRQCSSAMPFGVRLCLGAVRSRGTSRRRASPLARRRLP